MRCLGCGVSWFWVRFRGFWVVVSRFGIGVRDFRGLGCGVRCYAVWGFRVRGFEVRGVEVRSFGVSKFGVSGAGFRGSGFLYVRALGFGCFKVRGFEVWAWGFGVLRFGFVVRGFRGLGFFMFAVSGSGFNGRGF